MRRLVRTSVSDWTQRFQLLDSVGWRSGGWPLGHARCVCAPMEHFLKQMAFLLRQHLCLGAGVAVAGSTRLWVGDQRHSALLVRVRDDFM